MKVFEHIMAGAFYSFIFGCWIIIPALLRLNDTIMNTLAGIGLIMMVIGFIYGWREYSEFLVRTND